jgi:hypothetical protein
MMPEHGHYWVKHLPTDIVTVAWIENGKADLARLYCRVNRNEVTVIGVAEPPLPGRLSETDNLEGA